MVILEMPDPQMHAEIRKSFEEDDTVSESSLTAIKEWMKQTPHLPDTWEETGLLNFLRGCNYSLEKAKKKIDLYFTARATCPEFFQNRDVSRPEFKAIMAKAYGFALPGLTPAGCRVVVIAGKDKNFTSPDPQDAFKVVFTMADIRMILEKTGVAGDVIILDAGVVTPVHFAKVTPLMVKKFLTIIIDAYPIKLKEVHVVNVHPLIQVIFTWIKPLLKEKIIERVHFHSDGYESLYKFIPKEILPEEYGGLAGPLQKFHDAWHETMKEYVNWFKEQDNIKADINKRPGKAVDYDQLFGLEGSFRQLNVD